MEETHSKQPASADDFAWYHSEGDEDPLAPTVPVLPKDSIPIAESSESSMFFALS